MLHAQHALDAFSLELTGRLDDLYFDLGKGSILSRIWQHKLVVNGQETFFQQLRLASRVQHYLITEIEEVCVYLISEFKKNQLFQDNKYTLPLYQIFSHFE